MKKIINFIYSIPKDKQLHYIAGLLIVGFSYLIFSLLPVFIILTLIGLGKELIWDKLLGKGEFEWEDFGMTELGGLTIIFMVELSKLLPTIC